MFLTKVRKYFMTEKKQQKKTTDETQKKNKTVDVIFEEKIMEQEDKAVSMKNKGKLFVGGINYLTTSKELETYFSQFGKVADAVIIRYPKSGKSRGFGYVLFVDPNDAQSALKSRPHILQGKSVDVRHFTPSFLTKGDDPPKKNYKVFLGGLPYNITEDLLKQFFARYGEVVEVAIPLDKNTQKPKGFGFLHFEEEDAAEKCLSEGFVYLGGRRVQIKKAEPRGRLLSCSEAEVFLAEEFVECSENMSVLFGNQENSLFVENDVTSSAISGNESQGETDLQKIRDNTDLAFEVNNDDNIGTNTNDRWVSGEGFEGNFTNNLNELTAELIEVLLENSEVGYAEELDTGPEDERYFPMSVPFKFKNTKGSLFCSLCQWSSPENSCQSFLDHCKTSTHRIKLKDRFPRKEFETVKPNDGSQHSLINSKQVGDIDSFSENLEKDGIKKHQESKGQCKQQKKTLPKVNKCMKIQINNVNKKEYKNQSSFDKSKLKNKKIQDEKMTYLNAVALAKGMTFVQSSNNQLMCNVCNTKIPTAMDIQVLMKNAVSHLQSKKHLTKLLEKDNLITESLKKTQKNLDPQNKVPRESSNQKKVRKNISSTQQVKIPTHNNVALKTGSLNSQEKTATSKLFFLCLPCNYSNKNLEVFKAHLKSKSHLHSFIREGANIDISLDNLKKCKNCGFFLYGPLYYINKHYNKCK